MVAEPGICFKGAAAQRPRSRYSTAPVRGSSSTLQRGRGSKATVTLGPLGQRLDKQRLQRGRGSKATVTLGPLGQRLDKQRLQRGRGSKATVTQPTIRVVLAGQVGASKGPRLKGHGHSAPSKRPVLTICASKGPRLKGHGHKQGREGFDFRLSRLQRGRGSKTTVTAAGDFLSGGEDEASKGPRLKGHGHAVDEERDWLPLRASKGPRLKGHGHTHSQPWQTWGVTLLQRGRGSKATVTWPRRWSGECPGRLQRGRGSKATVT